MNEDRYVIELVGGRRDGERLRLGRLPDVYESRESVSPGLPMQWVKVSYYRADDIGDDGAYRFIESTLRARMIRWWDKS